MRRRWRGWLWGVVVCAGAGVARSAGAQATRTVWSGVYSEAQARDGETVFVDHCAECHGDDLGGIEKAPALAGGPFAQRWEGASLRKLFDRIAQMPPDEPPVLDAKQSADVLAFLLSANEFPAGTTALGTDRSALAGITFLSAPPR
jgi:mono/diheme cytochrome c family protein